MPLIYTHIPTPYSDFIETPNKTLAWCQYHASQVQKIFNCKDSLRANLLPFRDFEQCLNLKIMSENSDELYSITLNASGEFGADITESNFDVYDLVEAVHMIGILTQLLDLKVSIGNTRELERRSELAKLSRSQIKLVESDTDSKDN